MIEPAMAPEKTDTTTSVQPTTEDHPAEHTVVEDKYTYRKRRKTP